MYIIMGYISSPLMRVGVDIYEGKLCYIMQHSEDQAVLFVLTHDLRTDYLATPPPPRLSNYHAVFAALATLPTGVLTRALQDPRRALFLAPYVTMFASAQTTGDRQELVRRAEEYFSEWRGINNPATARQVLLESLDTHGSVKDKGLYALMVYHALTADDCLELAIEGVRICTTSAAEPIIKGLTFATGGQARQDDIDFLCAHDLPASESDRDHWITWSLEGGMASEEDRLLSTAFTKQLVDEAAASHRPPLVGQFRLSWTGGTFLDDAAKIDHLRVSIKHNGLWLSVVHEPDTRVVAWGWWSPMGDNLNIEFSDRYAWAIRILAASIWRDATIVRERAFPEQPRSAKNPPRPKSAAGEKLVVLPRTITTRSWGDPSERSAIESRTIRAAHAVRAFYRQQPDGWQTSEAARENAINLGYAPPPDGYTFVRPHLRGGGEEQASAAPAPRIVCRGLLTALTVLAKLAK
jgi:uncharacterized protein (DUF4415 family)